MTTNYYPNKPDDNIPKPPAPAMNLIRSNKVYKLSKKIKTSKKIPIIDADLPDKPILMGQQVQQERQLAFN